MNNRKDARTYYHRQNVKTPSTYKLESKEEILDADAMQMQTEEKLGRVQE